MGAQFPNGAGEAGVDRGLQQRPRVRLLEGLAMPREEAEFVLSYYNSMTTWIDLDKLLAVFGLSRNELGQDEQVTQLHALDKCFLD